MRLKWVNGLKWILYSSIVFMCVIFIFQFHHKKDDFEKLKKEQHFSTLHQLTVTAKTLMKKSSPAAITYTSAAATIPFDPFLNVLPHLQLLRAQNSNINLNPTFYAANSNNTLRSMGRLIIGIPTIKRLEKDYLQETIRNCLDNVREEETSLVTFVVLIAERQYDDHVSETVTALNIEFESAIENGILQIIMPPSLWYPPDLDFVSPTFNDSQERMIWRTKQNLDYAYLMIYAKYFFGFTDYYIQLEDDVISKTGYISSMTAFADTHKNWFACDFSKLGFIGKLFHTNDLPLLSNFILLFYRDKPVDWILDQLFLVKFCNHEEGGCIKKRINGVRRLYHKPALFQHIGRFSSLSGKVQSLKDSSFKLKTQNVAAPIQHTQNKKADQLSSNFSTLTLENLENFYNYSAPLVIIINQTMTDDNSAMKGTTLLKIKYFNPIVISSIGLRYFVRYRQNVKMKLPFKVNICEENNCFDLKFPHILHLKLTFTDMKNISSITVTLEQIADIETISLTSLLIN